MRRRCSGLLPLLLASPRSSSACATEARRVAAGSTSRATGSSRPATSTRRSTSRSPRTPGSTATRHRRATRWWRRRSTDVEAFWQRTYEDLYGDAVRADLGRLLALRPDTEQPPCGNPPPVLRRHRRATPSTAPAPTSSRGTTSTSIPGLYEEFGGFTLGIVFAHEFAHAIQTAVGHRWTPPIMIELQADCFAGAWTARRRGGQLGVLRGRRSTTSTRRWPASSSCATASAPPPADRPPTARASTASASFVGGLRAGRRALRGVPRRATTSGELVIVEVPFTDQDDFERGGNLPLDELGPILLADLENFWTLLFEEQGRDVDAGRRRGDRSTPPSTRSSAATTPTAATSSWTCPSTASTATPSTSTRSTSFPRSTRSATTPSPPRSPASTRSPRRRASVTSRTPRRPTSRPTAWPASTPRSGFLGDREGRGQELFLSPGDLDEAVIAFLSHQATRARTVGDDEVSVGTAFQRFDAYRDGFLEGAAACDALG